MPLQKLILRPGIDTQKTSLLNEGGWSECNLVRFRDGLPEVYGGWVPFLLSPVQGVCRGLHAYSTLASLATMGAGTTTRLYLIQASVAYDITPVVQTTTPNNPYSTTIGLATVVVSDPALTITPTVGTFIEVAGGVAVGGLTISGEYAIQTVTSATTYTITASSVASATVAGGGGIPTIQYLLPAGVTSFAPPAGWGVGPWGAETWGTARTVASANLLPRTWTLDNFGDYLVANPRGGGIYSWLPAGGTGTRATAITNAPTSCNAIFVANDAQQLIALGATPAGGGTFNPMLVAWTDNSDYTVWAAASGNSAGSYPLTDGSQLMWGGKAGQQNLIWSDTALYAMIPVGGTAVYGFRQVGTNCGLIGPNAAGIIGNRAYWMSNLNFMWYNGTVQELDCPVRDIVFKNLNVAQAGKIVCGVNTQFSELRWDYPSASSDENDSYVIFNYAEKVWSYGGNFNSSLSISRTAWHDFNVFGSPVGFDANGNSWSHETGYSAGGSAMPWTILSGEIDLSDGTEIAFVDHMIPDQILENGIFAITVFAKNYTSNGTIQDYQAPFQISSTSTFIKPRLRAMQLSVQFSNAFSNVGVFWRHGALRARVAPDGRP